MRNAPVAHVGQSTVPTLRSHVTSIPTPGDAPPLLDDGYLCVDLARREAFLQGEAVPLARKEYALLALLAQHRGHVVTPQKLRERWGQHYEHDTHYARMVGKLRQKLNDDPAAPRWIATGPGVGLRLIGEEVAS